MNGFDPAAEFLLDMNWINLFEPAVALPTNDRWRCKGCRAIITQGDREKHHQQHIRERRRAREKRQAQLNRERVKRLADARRRATAA